MVAMTIQAVVTPQARLFRLGGWSNWGVTPSGGARAGAASSSSRDVGGIVCQVKSSHGGKWIRRREESPFNSLIARSIHCLRS